MVERTGKPLQERVKGLRNGVVVFFLLFFFFLFFPILLAPGIGTTVRPSPLDRFLIENYSFWFLVFIFSSLGGLFEILPMSFFLSLYVREVGRVASMEEADFAEYKIWGVFLIGLLSLFVIIILPLPYNPVRFSLPMYIAKLKGYHDPFYNGYVAFASVGWFATGSFFVIAVTFLQLYRKITDKYKHVLEEGKEVKERRERPLLRRILLWVFFGLVLPIIILQAQTVYFALVMTLSLVGLISLSSTLLLILYPPVMWHAYSNQKYQKAAYISMVWAILVSIFSILLPLYALYRCSFHPLSQIVLILSNGIVYTSMFTLISIWLFRKE